MLHQMSGTAIVRLALASTLAAAASFARADSTVNILNGGILQASGPATGAGVVTNVLPAPGASGVTFSFSGSLSDTVSFQQGAAAGYSYDDYVLTVAPSTATAVTIAIDFTVPGLTVADLQTRWYSYSANNNSFLQGAGGVGVIAGTTTVSGVAITSQIANIPLQAGTYVFEIAGLLTAGVSTYGGSLALSSTPVPEPGAATLMLAGLALLGAAAGIRRARGQVQG